MLKETENEETRLFCQIFVIGSILIGEVWARDDANNKKCIHMLRRVPKPCPHAAPRHIQTQLSSRCTAPQVQFLQISTNIKKKLAL